MPPSLKKTTMKEQCLRRITSMLTWEPESEETYTQVRKLTTRIQKRTGIFKGQMAIPTEIKKSKHISNVKTWRGISKQLRNYFWAVSL